MKAWWMYRDCTEILPEIFFLNQATNVSRQLLSLPVYVIVIAKQRYGTVVHSEQVVNIPATCSYVGG